MEMMYYIRDEKNVPIGAVVLTVHENGKVSRGVSMCSTVDKFSKDRAKKIAFSRLKAALGKKMNIRPCVPYNGVDEKKHSRVCPFDYYGFFEDEPTKFEYRMMHKPID